MFLEELQEKHVVSLQLHVFSELELLELRVWHDILKELVKFLEWIRVELF